MAQDLFIQLSIIVVVAAAFAGLARMLKQPPILGYIATGLIVGTLIQDGAFTLFAHVGISLLLFMVGLNLNPNVIKHVGKVSLITGIGQVLFTSILGYLIARTIGFDPIPAIYLAVALTFSSTIIILKLLADKHDLDTLYGKISIGFLIVQDIIVVFILLFISSLTQPVDTITLFVQTIVLLLVTLGALYLISRYVFPKLLQRIARNHEYLMIFSIAWCFALAAGFHLFNFSMEIGALLAGIAFSMTPYRHEINSKMKPLRDFFLVIFFITLGSQTNFASMSQYLLPIILFSVFILIGNPLIVMILMGGLGYTKRNSFLAGLTVAQISEFSLILIGLGVSIGHLHPDMLSIVTLIGLITIGISTYLILNANSLYKYLSPMLAIFERKGRKTDEHAYRVDSYDVVLFGHNRIGYTLLSSFKKLKKKVLVIDYDPDVIKTLTEKNIPNIYRDANDEEFLEELSFNKVDMVVSTIPNEDTNRSIINAVRAQNKKSIIICVSHSIDEAMRLYESGATYILLPHFLGGTHASALIEQHNFDIKKFSKEKSAHLRHLRERKMLKHEHPTHQ